MCIFLCMGGNSTTWMNTAILVTCIRNFRKNRGPVSGILKGYVGLSTAIFTDICTALFSDSASSFLLMLAVVPFGVCLIAMLFLHEVPPSAADEGGNQDDFWYFTALNSVAVVIAFYLLAYDFIGSSHGQVFNLVFVGILLVLLALPLLIPLYDLLKSFKKSGLLDVEGAEAVDAPLIASQETMEAEVQCQQVTEEPEAVANEVEEVKGQQPAIGEDHTIFELMRTYDFWILFVSFLCGVGTGLAVQNNMGQIGSSLGYGDVSVFVSLISIWGFFGRIISGTGSEYLIK